MSSIRSDQFYVGGGSRRSRHRSRRPITTIIPAIRFWSAIQRKGGTMAHSKGVRLLDRDNVQHRSFERSHIDNMSDMSLSAQTDFRYANPDSAIPARVAAVVKAVTRGSAAGIHNSRRRLGGSTRAADS